MTAIRRAIRAPNKAARRNISENAQLWTLALPAVIQLFVFSYLPIFGVVLAFKKFNVTKGIMGSAWVGLENFRFYFTSLDASRTLRNTLTMNALFIAIGTVCSIALALALFEAPKRGHVKFFQTVFVLPHLVSWVVVSYIAYTLLQPTSGLINGMIKRLGGTAIQWYTQPKYWPAILVCFSVWKGVGMSSLYYYGSLMGVDEEIFEAARLDGAGRLQIAWHVSLPFLVPTITVLTILSIGGIFRADFGLFYNVTMNNGMLYPTTDVIDTYIYRALMKVGNIGMSSAVGLFQSLVGMALVLATNAIVRRIDADRALI
ncbi:MAG: ABC transporter permease subunit [Oscillospiraceae bacterium]|jgi:putative aldouronate transport system permease protein|nr:ABC transporter permease subunit [Oscillospiraceae bacterium]